MNDQAMGEFLSACGSAGPLVLGVEEPGTSSSSWRVLDQPFVVVGRDPGADLFLNDPGVSRRHAYLQLIAGRLFCVDLQSRTGTRWGNEPGLWGWAQPEPGVRIGPFRVRPREGSPGGTVARDAGGSDLPVPVSRSFVQPELPEATLEIPGMPAGSSTWRISRSVVLIGGSQACKIRLPGAGVSDFHASLVLTPSGLFVVDLLRSGGILVNGEGARWARIGEDDEISVAGYRIRMRCARPEGPARTDGGSGTWPKSRQVGVPAGRHPARSGDVGTGGVLIPSRMGDDTASLVRSMLDEFGRAQLEMADRFQETIMAVLQSFAGFHGEQMALIREELARIRELTDEQQALKAKVESGGHAVAGAPVLRLVNRGPRRPTSGPTRAESPTMHGKSIPVLTIRDSVERPRSEGPAALQVPESGPRPPVPAELHAQIVNRIAEIQDERQGRWQKLLKSLMG